MTRVLRGGIDLGGTKIQAVVIDDEHNVRGQARRRTPTQGGPRAVAEEIAGATREAALAAGVGSSELIGVGVGSPGEIDDVAGTVSEAGNLPAWQGTYELGPVVAELVGTQVRLENDVRVATDAEARLGAGRPYHSLLGVFWGTGIGGALILEGRPWLGQDAAGEIGHTVVQHAGGRQCPCGRRGCLEAYAGRGAMEARARKLHRGGQKTKLFKLMKKRGRDRLTSGVWARALGKNDKLAIELIDDAVDALGAGIASAVNLLDVEAVIIGGGLGVRLGRRYARRIETAMRPHLFAKDHRPAVHVAALGDLGGAIGAALLVSAQEAQ